MWVVCSDLEGVFVPEVWINVAKITGIEKLKITTRDEPDYDKLMKYRLNILDEHNLKIQDIQQVISNIKPLDGALEFTKWLRDISRFVIVSDTFQEFAKPLMKQLDDPFILCHSLEIDKDGRITNYKLRQSDPKRHTVEAFQSMNFKVIAFGDSYNDVSMLKKAEVGILFCPPQKVIDEFPELPVAHNYAELKALIEQHIYED
ncbi:MAG: bifunctional phosphoserine phosphatase/homoserine phosphotransferase ThrH [Bacteroidales bacterium]|nr:bifunctional phosphoserine phosphatase/homoserine phosphotransferase ThrH [Bacteroidales bacterium]MBQ4215983.1 bifunctional phosphoserine phosphatase/homoserine phosphotransferase ThrH [Bacteroidales bacterium]MBR4497544.1 bifunctional phosphoserine phosphatase/homoserine phosphotransferase ThrH [Bacteroidales bacterium]